LQSKVSEERKEEGKQKENESERKTTFTPVRPRGERKLLEWGRRREKERRSLTKSDGGVGHDEKQIVGGTNWGGLN